MPERPCSSLETHRWSMGSTTYLSLPASDGWMDVFRSWHCRTCGLHTWATGAVDVTTPPLTPIEWQARATAQQAGGDLYGQAARQQEQWERQQRGVTRRLREGRLREARLSPVTPAGNAQMVCVPEGQRR